MKRKTFIQKSFGALLLVAPSYALLNCSNSDDSNNDGNQGGDPNCIANGARASSVSGNHGHSLTVSSADVSAGIEKTYSITGSSNHSHQVTVTAANFEALSNNQQIMVNSTTGNGHTHSVTISCA